MSQLDYQPKPYRRKKRKKTSALSLLGIVILVMWTVWWAASFDEFRLVDGGRTWIPIWPFLGLDFMHNYLAAIHVWNGGNPFIEQFGDERGLYAYLPVTLVFFFWCKFFTFVPSVIVFTLSIVVIVGVGAWLSQKMRERLKLYDLPLPFILGATLFSTPVMFAMERGNCDAIILGLLLVCVWAMTLRKTWLAETIVGVAMGVAVLVKIYPGMLILGLIALRRFRATGITIATIIVVTLLTLPYTKQWTNTMFDRDAPQRARIGPLSSTWQWLKNPMEPPQNPFIFTTVSGHSLSDTWLLLTDGVPIIGTMPGPLGAGLVTISLALWISWRMFRCERRLELRYPYLLYQAVLATFWMPFSFDYNLIYFPLAVLAVWDRRDWVVVHLLFAPALIWWQPFEANIGPLVLMKFKLAAVLALTLSLWQRIRELEVNSQTPQPADEQIPSGHLAVVPTLAPVEERA